MRAASGYDMIPESELTPEVRAGFIRERQEQAAFLAAVEYRDMSDDEFETEEANRLFGATRALIVYKSILSDLPVDWTRCIQREIVEEYLAIIETEDPHSPEVWEWRRLLDSPPPEVPERPAADVLYRASSAEKDRSGGDGEDSGERRRLLETFADFRAIFSGEGPRRQEPAVGQRTDGRFLLYRGAVNSIIGESGVGKSWFALANVTEELGRGGHVLYVDLDHNGARNIGYRLADLGVPMSTIADLDRFRYAAPSDAHGVESLIGFDLFDFAPTLIVIDTVGELIGRFNGNSNSEDDWRRISNAVPVPMAETGAAVLIIDHISKNADAARFGATGTQAKKGTIDGVMLRLTAVRPFAPGRGGVAEISVVKDRPGGVIEFSKDRARREPLAGSFELSETDGELHWQFVAPELPGAPGTEFDNPTGDVDALDLLDPPPTGVTDVRKRMKWGTARASSALRDWRAKHASDEGGASA